MNGKTVSELYQELEKLQAEQNALGKEISEVKKFLAKKIPVNTVKQGVRHTEVSRSTVPWKNSVTYASENLIPKTRLQELEDWIEKHTKVSTYSRFSIEK